MGLSQFQFEKDDFSLQLKKGSDHRRYQRFHGSDGKLSLPLLPLRLLSLLRPHRPPAAPASAPAADAAPAAPAGEAITSPMVGTFYGKPSPEADAFVKVGDSVSEGQTICIIEAMKVMNEIKAEQSGVVAEICVEDGTPVQFGDPIFRLK